MNKQQHICAFAKRQDKFFKKVLTSEKFFCKLLTVIGIYIGEIMITKKTLLIGSIALLGLGGAFDSNAALDTVLFVDLTFTDTQGQKTRQHITNRGFVGVLKDTADEAVGTGEGTYSNYFDCSKLTHMRPFVEKGPHGFMAEYHHSYLSDMIQRSLDTHFEPGTLGTFNFLCDVANSEDKKVYKAMLHNSFDEYCMGDISDTQFFMQVYGILCLLDPGEPEFGRIDSLMKKRDQSQEHSDMWRQIFQILRQCRRDMDSGHTEIDGLFDDMDE
ncbi:MAG: hypothetical protein LBL30_04310 [Holosporales bacterium]|nr:hypothetical protein [Holosporales bacterium]